MILSVGLKIAGTRRTESHWTLNEHTSPSLTAPQLLSERIAFCPKDGEFHLASLPLGARLVFLSLSLPSGNIFLPQDTLAPQRGRTWIVSCAIWIWQYRTFLAGNSGQNDMSLFTVCCKVSCGKTHQISTREFLITCATDFPTQIK